jgi:hypothetical protein
MATRHDYEWVVEEVDAEGDILDCHYWDDLDAALDQALALADGGAVIDFGLCRHYAETFADGGEPEEGGRAYVYLGPSGWPDRLDDGAALPKRFTPSLDRAAKRLRGIIC